MERGPLVALAVAGSALLLPGQQPTLTLSALSPLTATAQAGSQVVNTSVPAGELPTTGACYAFAGTFPATYAQAETRWATYGSDVVASCGFNQRLFTVGGSGLAAGTGVQEFLLEVACPVQRPVALEILLAGVATPGAPTVTTEIDIGNDGLLDYWGAFHNGSYTRSAVIGPQPLLVRFRLSGSLPVNYIGYVQQNTGIVIRPDNGLVIANAGAGCLDNGVAAVPTWANDGVALGDVNLPPLPAAPWNFLVAGLQPQSTLLPAIGTALPCVVTPSPDFVVGVTTDPSSFGHFVIGLPPAVRPVSVWLQYVLLLPDGRIGTTNAQVVAAQ